MKEDTKLKVGDLMPLIENFPINYSRSKRPLSKRSRIEIKAEQQFSSERIRVLYARKEGKINSTYDTCKKIVRLK